MSSIDSSENDHQRRLADELQLSAGLNRLSRMSALRSTHRNLADEDDAIRRNVEAHERQMFGADLPDPRPPTEGDDMDIMAARDVYINSPKPVEATPAPATRQPPVEVPATVPVLAAAPTPSPPAPATAPMSTAAKVGLIATALAVGAGPPAAVATYYAMRPQPQIDRPDNVGGVGLLPPAERKTK